MKVIIAGSRSGPSYADLTYALAQCGFREEITEVVSGSALGADAHGERWAKTFGLPVKHFLANWETYGKNAGPLRNEQMAQYADALVLVWDGQSRGSSDMLKRAKRHGLKVWVHRIKPVGAA